MDVPQALLCKAGHDSLHLNATAASFHHSHLLRHRVGVLLHSYFKKIAPLNQVFRLKDKWCPGSIQFKGFNSLQLSNDAFTSNCSIAFSFFNGGGHEGHFDKAGMFNSNSNISRKNQFNGRKWTNVLLAANILFYIAQLATQGKLLLWGAKINSLIDKGQLWRLVTSSFLHANIGHLMVNCYSLNSVGPTVESFSGPRRYLAVYFASAIASSAMSYQFSRMPAVGASGAIFGLIGSVAVFVLRHKDIVGGGKEDLLHIARVIALNMVLGLLSNGIDNWGHLGGLIGGVAASWLIGPAWKYESTTRDGRRVFSDSAPMYNFFRITRVPKQWK